MGGELVLGEVEMAENSKIEWTDHSFNPWRGCQKVSSGCKNCYAETLINGRMQSDFSGLRTVLSEAGWREPLKWNRLAATDSCPYCGCYDLGPCCDGSVGCNGCERFFTPHRGPRPRVFLSLCDPFEGWDGPMVDHKGDRLFWANPGAATTNGEWVDEPNMSGDEEPVTMNDVRGRLFKLIDSTPNLDWLLLTKRPENIPKTWPDLPGCWEGEAPYTRSNVWLGTSVENQEMAIKRVTKLMEASPMAAKLFLSCEPLLGPVDLSPWCGGPSPDIAWCIAGGESGRNARPCNIEWIRSLRDQCREANVPFFCKQLGSRPEHYGDEDPRSLALKDRKGGNLEEWPEDLRVREFPEE